MHVNLDPQLVDKIANEVKSQGVFDQFRKDSMADVDTKPAYQNLRQRVENTVNKFLSEQKWTPDLNKNQLRERLRKHITEAGFLDVGVERIVDQVVNPKIATVFQPKIEDIAYKYIGIPKPQVKTNTSEVPTLNGMLTIETDLMPTDLEQVSPDSDKDTHKSDTKDDVELDDKMDDFESPPFEPIEIKPNDQEMEIHEDVKKEEIATMIETTDTPADGSAVLEEEIKSENKPEGVKIETSTPVKMEDDREMVVSGEASQESQLSQVSSDSRLSIVTNDNTQEEHSITCKIKEENEVNISEEAQMPKFNENSNSSSEKKSTVPLHFDIKKDEIKFEGTERKLEPPTEELSPNTSEEIRLDNSLESKIVDNSQNNDIPLPSHEYSFEKDKEFKFSKIEVNVELEEVTKTASLDDSADRELQIIEKSEISQCSISQQSIKSPTSRQDKIKPSSATSSPSQHKSSSYREKDHSSSSRHKKHSKDRRSEKERHSSSSHKASSSTSLKYHSSKSSSSHKVSSASSDYHHHRSSSSSMHKSRHTSKNGKSSRSHHDSSHSRDHSKSKYEKSKEKSSKDKSERSKTSDDHYSSKQKWRKSTDSNDEGDSSRDDQSTSLPKDSSSSRDNATNGTLNSSTTSSGNPSANNPSETGANADTQCSNSVNSQNIVILDNLLGNPDTNFIEIGNASFQVNTSVSQTPNCSYDGNFLYYFENDSQSKNDFDSRIKILTHNMEDIRKLLQTNLNFPRKLSTTESEGNTSLEMDKNHAQRDSSSPRGCTMKRHLDSPNNPPSLTSATLTIDCIQYGGNTSTSNCLNKRYKFNGTSVTKVSPTPSELSVNSKENEFVDKNALSDSESSVYPNNTKRDTTKTVSEKRNKVVNRNQRYSSEDLYKPRPILSQRSRRRGLDAVI